MKTRQVRIVIKNLFLILRCFLFFVFNGRADKEILSPKSVIVVQRAKLGDMIVTTSVFRTIKEKYPNCRVTVIGNTMNKKVLEGNRDVDNYIVWVDDIDTMIARLELDHYDFGCITSPNFHSLTALYLSGIKSIAVPVIRNGWSPYETMSYKIIRRLVILKDHRMRHYVPREYLRLLEPIGINSQNIKKYIYWSEDGEKEVKKIISNIKLSYQWLIGIMPGAGNKIKQWPAERFGRVADYLVEKYNAHILIIGSEGNREEIREMLNVSTHKESMTDTSFVSIDELKALVSKLDFTVSVDTGPVYIAEATGVPTVDITGAIDTNEMSPNDGEYHLVVKSSGKPQIWTMNARIYDYNEARRQIESITIEMVIQAIDSLISKIENKRASQIK